MDIAPLNISYVVFRFVHRTRSLYSFVAKLIIYGAHCEYAASRYGALTPASRSSDSPSRGDVASATSADETSIQRARHAEDAPRHSNAIPRGRWHVRSIIFFWRRPSVLCEATSTLYYARYSENNSSFIEISA